MRKLERIRAVGSQPCSTIFLECGRGRSRVAVSMTEAVSGEADVGLKTSGSSGAAWMPETIAVT